MLSLTAYLFHIAQVQVFYWALFSIWRSIWEQKRFQVIISASKKGCVFRYVASYSLEKVSRRFSSVQFSAYCFHHQGPFLSSMMKTLYGFIFHLIYIIYQITSILVLFLSSLWVQYFIKLNVLVYWTFLCIWRASLRSGHMPYFVEGLSRHLSQLWHTTAHTSFIVCYIYWILQPRRSAVLFYKGNSFRRQVTPTEVPSTAVELVLFFPF